MPPLEHGYWGKPTSTLDWCETNYEFNYYIAEMTNTLSNLMMIIPPLWGVYEVYRQGFEKRFIYCHLLLLVVGLGSWAFHMTLLYEMQLFDELPMVWGTSVLVYSLVEVQRKGDGQRVNLSLIIFLLGFCISFTSLYLLWPQPLIQQVSYGLLVFSTFALEIQIIKSKHCAVCKRIFFIATFTYLFGFFLWNIDNIYCSNLQSLRGSLPVIFNPFTQLHGWWHVLAGYGTHLQILFTIHSFYDFKTSKQKSRRLDHCGLGITLQWKRTKSI